MPDEVGKRRQVYLAGALAVALVGLVFGSALVWLHLAWAAHVATVGVLVGRKTLSFRGGGLLSSIGGAVFLPLIFDRAGVHLSAVATLLVCMPLIIAALVPDDRGSVLVFAVAAIGWLAWGAWALPSSERWVMLLISAACSAIALLATMQHARVKAAEGRATTDRLLALERLAASERLAIIGKLVAGVAHEINNPLAYVASSTRFLKSEHSDEAERAEAWKDVEQGLARIQLIVDDLRLFARPEDRGSPCQPEHALEEALKVASARLNGVEVVRAFDVLPKVAMGEGRLVQVLVNLISNAADAVAGCPRRVVTVTGRAEGDVVTLTVDDSGAGLAPEVLERIFEPWFTTKGRRGTGLGLALCREYVTLASGQLTASNHEGGGARFTLTLPVVQGQGGAAGLSSAE
ncbi:MAG: sensor histidine kinase [Myxococcota bacterium]